jgi:hypothetical protein
MLVLGVKNDIEKLTKHLTDLSKKQIPFATMLALNQTAKSAKEALTAQLKVTFDRPTPYTVNSLFVKPATKSKLVARVEHKDFLSKGKPPGEYLQPQIEGGLRKQKRSEVALGRLIGMPRGYWTPGPGAQLDAYGNIKNGDITKILSAVQALGEQGYLGNRTAASAKRKGKALEVYFVVPKNNPRGMAPGVYQRFGRAVSTEGRGKKKTLIQQQGAIVPVLFFHERVTYDAIYDMAGTVERITAAEFGKRFAASLDYALQTAKR